MPTAAADGAAVNQRAGDPRMNPFPLAVAELRRNPSACVAIVLLIAIAVAIGIAVSAQERALRESSARAADRFDLIVGAPGSTTQLVLTTVYLQPAPLELLRADALVQLTHDPGVAAVAPVAVTDSYLGHTVVGTTAAFAAIGGLDEGRIFTHRHEAVVGAAVPLPLGRELVPAHGSATENLLETHEHSYTLKIVGRLRAMGTQWDRAIIVPIEAVWAMHADARAANAAASPDDVAPLGPPWTVELIDRVPAIVVKPRSVTDAYQLRARYRGHETIAVFPAEVLVPLYALLGIARDLVSGMAFAFQALLLLSVLLVIVVALTGRQQSIGVLRALGAPSSFVFATVWLQSALLIAAGVLAGAVLGWGLSRMASAWVSTRTGLAIDVTPGRAEVLWLLALLGAGSLLSVLPSLAALRISADRLLRLS
jgi:putative ABC transport system permease protein